MNTIILELRKDHHRMARILKLMRNALDPTEGDLDAEHADIMSIMGEELAFYNEIRNMSMKSASESTDGPEKLEAMRTALSAEADKHRFLQACGFYDNAKYVPQTSTEDDEV